MGNQDMDDISRKVIEKMVNEQLKKTDLTKYQKNIETAIQEYFESEEFLELIETIMTDSDFAYNFANDIAKKTTTLLKKKIKVSFA